MIGERVMELADRAARNLSTPHEDHYEDIRQVAAMKILELSREGVAFDTDGGWVVSGRRAAIDWLRGERSRTRDTDQEPAKYSLREWVEDHRCRADRRYLAIERLDELCRWLKANRPHRIEALLLTGLGYTAREVAGLTGYTEGAIHTLVYRTRKETLALGCGERDSSARRKP